MSAPTRDADHWLATLRDVGAIERGHFALSSGLHSGEYVQCARLLEQPDLVAEAARDLVDLLSSRIDRPPRTVAAPAMGAVVLGYEVARAWGARSIWAERDRDGNFSLRRGFALGRGEPVVLVEDVVTTAGSVRELEAVCRDAGAEIVGVAMLVDRSGEGVEWSVPAAALVELEVDQYRPESCPHCGAGRPVTRPGSRSATSGTNAGS